MLLSAATTVRTSMVGANAAMMSSHGAPSAAASAPQPLASLGCARGTGRDRGQRAGEQCQGRGGVTEQPDRRICVGDHCGGIDVDANQLVAQVDRPYQKSGRGQLGADRQHRVGGLPEQRPGAGWCTPESTASGCARRAHPCRWPSSAIGASRSSATVRLSGSAFAPPRRSAPVRPPPQQWAAASARAAVSGLDGLRRDGATLHPASASSRSSGISMCTGRGRPVVIAENA